MSAATTLKANETVLGILRRADRDDTGLTLPEQLDRKDYQAVNKFLEAAGAKWNKKVKRHLFTGSAKQTIEELLGTGKMVHKKNLRQAFYTPDEIAAKLVNWADVLHGQLCLEPSAGAGAIAKHMHAADGYVTCVDIEEDAIQVLKRGNYQAVVHNDFMKLTAEELGGPFDRIVMNPPFTKNQAFQHVLHAYEMLGSGGILVAVLPCSTPTGKLLQARWEALILHGVFMDEFPAGTFKASGTDVRTRALLLAKA